MPKLKPIDIDTKAETGERLTYHADVTVGNDGIFSITIPEDLVPVATGFLSEATPAERATIWVAKPRVYSKIQCKDLKAGEQFLRRCLVDFAKCETTTERIIIYGIAHRAHYVKHDDGQILPNGSWTNDYGKKANWAGSEDKDGFGKASFSSNLDPQNYYYIGFSATVYDKHIHTRQSYTSFDLERVSAGKGTPAGRLNSFVHIHINEEDLHGLKTMAYSDKAATFFFDMMMSICKMNDRVSAFFADDNAIKLAIENKTPVFALPRPVKQED